MSEGPAFLGTGSVYIAQPEGRLHVLAAGEAGPPVLLLSGAGLDNARLSWKHLIPALAENRRVFALDWPKQGGSGPWNGVADHAACLRCIHAVLDHFGLEKADVVGLSQGGALTLAFAIQAPDRIGSAVAIAPGGIIDFPPVAHQLLWLTAKLPWLVSGLYAPVMRSRAAVAAFVRRALFPGPVADFDDVVDEIMAEAARRGVSASDWQNNSIGFLRMKVDLRPDLHRIRCPVLLIQGDRDVAIRPRFTQAAAALIPDAELMMLEGHGHWPNRQSPELVNRLIAGFLDDKSPPHSPAMQADT